MGASHHVVLDVADVRPAVDQRCVGGRVRGRADRKKDLRLRDTDLVKTMKHLGAAPIL